MGILSLVMCCCSWIGLVLGILGIIFAIMSRGDGEMCGQAKTGLILSIVGVAVNVILILIVIMFQIFDLLPGAF